MRWLCQRLNASNAVGLGGRRARPRRFSVPLVSSTHLAARSALCSVFASTEYLPVFQFALRDLANPSGVFGPVLGPPSIRQRPFGIAGALQEAPSRLLAPF